jgi:hypothetical protein
VFPTTTSTSFYQRSIYAAMADHSYTPDSQPSLCSGCVEVEVDQPGE